MVRLYVDTNAFIAAFEQTGEVSDQLVSLFSRSPPRQGPLLATSALTAAELLSKPFELGKTHLADFYQELTLGTDFLDVLPISRDVLLRAAAIRATNKSLKLPDAIHVASAIKYGCTHFLTNDTDIRCGFMFQPVRLELVQLTSLLAELDDGH